MRNLLLPFSLFVSLAFAEDEGMIEPITNSSYPPAGGDRLTEIAKLYLKNDSESSFCDMFKHAELVEKILSILGPSDSTYESEKERVNKILLSNAERDSKRQLKDRLLKEDPNKFFTYSNPAASVRMNDALDYIIGLRKYAEGVEEKLYEFETEFEEISETVNRLESGVARETLLMENFMTQTKTIRSDVSKGDNGLQKLVDYSIQQNLQLSELKNLQQQLDNDWLENADITKKRDKITKKASWEFELLSNSFKLWKDHYFIAVTHLGFPKFNERDFRNAKRKGCEDDSYVKDSLYMYSELEDLKVKAKASDKFKGQAQAMEKQVIAVKTLELPGHIRHLCSCTFKFVKQTAEVILKIAEMNVKLEAWVQGFKLNKRDALREEFLEVAKATKDWLGTQTAQAAIRNGSVTPVKKEL